MNTDRLLTVAIHTYDKALRLKTLLESEGIEVVLHNVNLSEPTVSSGVRVRIKEADLPLALRIIENSEIFIIPDQTTSADSGQQILVPVDFSTYSTNACYLAFDIAARQNVRICLLHAYTVPERINIPLAPTISIDPDDPGDPDIDRELNRIAVERLDKFAAELRTMIKQGQLPPVKFTTEVIASVPEDAVNEYAKLHKPLLIVMGTRGADKKERELIGSVTAEVLDSCREPVLTLPEQANIKTLNDIQDVCVPCNLDQGDILAIDTLERLMAESPLNVTLIYIERRRSSASAIAESSRLLLEYCRTHYPLATFNFESISADKAPDYFRSLSGTSHGTLLVIPNKKKNILSRIFNPSLAHRLLFHADIPLMAIPV